MLMRETIETRLRQGLSPERLEVIDESEMHRGHAGYRDGGESHFRVRIAATALTPLSRLDRHRAIHRALGREVTDRLHALAIEIV